MSARGRKTLWSLLAAGLAARLALAFSTYGIRFDVDSLGLAAAALRDDPLDLYAQLNEGPVGRWPYPSGFFPFLLGADSLADSTGAAFHGVVQLPQIVADLAIAWLVQLYLGMRGAGERVRLQSAALVALGPSFIAISGYHGQIDSVAILPGVAALVVWERAGPGQQRALLAGALIGLGAAVKTVPLVLVFALLPSCRSWRERLVLVLAAGAVPVIALAPWLAYDLAATTDALRYSGAPGVNGIGLFVQPELVEFWLGGQQVTLTGVSTWLVDHGSEIATVVLLCGAAFVWRRRLEPVHAATVLWLVVYAFGINLFFQYLVWGIPFFLMAGHRRAVVALQAVAGLAVLILYLAPWEHYLRAAAVYVPLAVTVWGGLVVALVVQVRRARAAPRPAATAP